MTKIKIFWSQLPQEAENHSISSKGTKKVINGTGVDELLVVTFTKAAAEEMKERIKQELRKELQKIPKNAII